MSKAKSKTKHTSPLFSQKEPYPKTTPLTESQNLENILIPGKHSSPLTKQELAEMVAEDALVHKCFQQVQKLSNIMYGNSRVLNKQLVRMTKNPETGQQLANQIERSPSSIAPLAGFDFLFFKSHARANALNHVEAICCAVVNYGDAVRHARKEITQEHETEQTRRAKAVASPSPSLQDLLSLPPTQQKEALLQSPELKQELTSFMQHLNRRLSSDDNQAIKHHDSEKLAKSLGVPENKAEEIIGTVQKAKEAQKNAQEVKVQRSQTLAMAS
ncbi:hypothetical protein ABID23_000673 [Bartonella silvatica]|uniref:Uncharacterized protein n=1 Tax=Bartonella silvatica TaxID=357760 RepID=A0ABV2HGB3_9HYPH